MTPITVSLQILTSPDFAAPFIHKSAAKEKKRARAQGWALLPLKSSRARVICNEMLRRGLGTRAHLQSPLLHKKKEGTKHLLETPLLPFMIELKSLTIRKYPCQNPQKTAVFARYLNWRDRLLTGGSLP